MAGLQLSDDFLDGTGQLVDAAIDLAGPDGKDKSLEDGINSALLKTCREDLRRWSVSGELKE